MYIINVIIDRATAINHNDAEYLIKNARGSIVKVIPIAANAAIMARQMVWQTCHEPKMLVIPETLPAIETAFSFAAILFTSIFALTIFCSTPLLF